MASWVLYADKKICSDSDACITSWSPRSMLLILKPKFNFHLIPMELLLFLSAFCKGRYGKCRLVKSGVEWRLWIATALQQSLQNAVLHLLVLECASAMPSFESLCAWLGDDSKKRCWEITQLWGWHLLIFLSWGWSSSPLLPNEDSEIRPQGPNERMYHHPSTSYTHTHIFHLEQYSYSNFQTTAIYFIYRTRFAFFN